MKANYYNELKRLAKLKTSRSLSRWIKWNTLINSDNPGDIIKGILMKNDITLKKFSTAMNMSLSACHYLVSGKLKITSEKALRLSYVLGENPETWLQLQYEYELSKTTIDYKSLSKLSIFSHDEI